MADHAAGTRRSCGRAALGAQDPVHGVGDVLERVGERAVEVEDDRRRSVHVRVRSRPCVYHRALPFMRSRACRARPRHSRMHATSRRRSRQPRSAGTNRRSSHERTPRRQSDHRHGRGSGIGKATAIRFAEEGARVTCVDIDGDGVAATAREIGEAAFAVQADIADPEQVQAYTDGTVAALGPARRRLQQRRRQPAGRVPRGPTRSSTARSTSTSRARCTAAATPSRTCSSRAAAR